MKRFDYIAGYHLNPYTCGVAKFNSQLASLLDIRVIGITSTGASIKGYGLISIKFSEFSHEHHNQLVKFIEKCEAYSLFLHGFDDSEIEWRVITNAKKIYCGNSQIYSELKFTNKAISLFSPSTIILENNINLSDTSTECKIFTFGMSHKVRVHYYARLNEILTSANINYTISLSTGFHEGESISDFYSYTLPSFIEIFGNKLKFMGMLSDALVAKSLQESDYFTAFFAKGIRENNSSAIACLHSNSVLITNIDADSPRSFINNFNCHDINQINAVDLNKSNRELIRKNAQNLKKEYTWKRLLEGLDCE